MRRILFIAFVLIGFFANGQSLGTAPYYINPIDSTVKIPATINGTLRNLYPFDIGKPYFVSIQRFLDSMAAVNSRIVPLIETDPTIPHTADASTNKYLNWNGSAYIRKQIDYSEIANAPDKLDSVRLVVDSLKEYRGATPIGIAKVALYNVTNPLNGDYLKYLNGQWVNFTPASSLSSDSLRVLSAPPKTGNVYLNSIDNRVHYKSGTTWYRLAVQDSVLNTGAGNVNFDLVTSVNESPAGTWNFTVQNTSRAVMTTRSMTGDGYYQFNMPPDALVEGLDVNSTQEFYHTSLIGNYNYAFFRSGTSMYVTILGQDYNTPTNIGAVGTYAYIRMNRTGGVMTIQASTDNVSFSTIYTFSGTSTGNLYIKASSSGANTNKLVNPKYNGFF